MTTQALLVAENPEFAHWLTSTLGSGIQVEMVRAGTAGAAGMPDLGSAGLVFVEVSAHAPDVGAGLIDALGEHHPDTAIFAVSESAPSDTVLAAMRAGASDYFVLGEDTDSVVSRVGKVLRRHAAGGSAGARKGRLFPVFSARPDDALALVAGHLALLNLEMTGPSERVLLLDLAQPVGTSLVYFNVTQTYQLTDALQDAYRIDQTLIDTAIARHASGMFVLSLAEEPLAYPPMDAADLLALIDTLRSHFSAVFVTFDAQLPLQAICGIVSQATRSLLVSDQSILRSRSNKTLLRNLRMEDVSLARTGLIIDRYQRQLGLEPDNLSNLLGIPVLARLRGNTTKRINAMNAGEPLLTLAPRDDFVTDLRALATALYDAGDGELDLPRGGFLSQLFG